jgi:hypothetical protein
MVHQTKPVLRCFFGEKRHSSSLAVTSQADMTGLGCCHSFFKYSCA